MDAQSVVAIVDSQTDHYSSRIVYYLITIDAKDDSCRVLLSNFEVVNSSQSGIKLERLASDKELCESINREGWVVVSSLAQHIRKYAEKQG